MNLFNEGSYLKLTQDKEWIGKILSFNIDKKPLYYYGIGYIIQEVKNMTYKISILTPVHISSGNKNACFLYHPDKNDHFNCYIIEDLLQFIPPQKLL